MLSLDPIKWIVGGFDRVRLTADALDKAPSITFEHANGVDFSKLSLDDKDVKTFLSKLF